jgi:hypothetical protein
MDLVALQAASRASADIMENCSGFRLGLGNLMPSEKPYVVYDNGNMHCANFNAQSLCFHGYRFVGTTVKLSPQQLMCNLYVSTNSGTTIFGSTPD